MTELQTIAGNKNAREKNGKKHTGRKQLVPVLILLCALTMSAFAGTACAATWTVGDNGDYTTLSEALSSGKMADGDILRLEAGDHAVSANVTLNKSLTIEGAGASSTTVDMGGFCFILKKNNITVKDLTVVNSSYGINVQSGGTDAVITDCVFDGLRHADGIKLNQSGAVFRNNIVKNTTGASNILLVGGNDTIIEGNTLSGNTGSGNAARVISVRNASNVSVIDNTIASNAAEGIRIWGARSADVLITGNVISGNAKGINFVDAGPNARIWGNDIFGNTADLNGTPGSNTIWSSEDKMNYTYSGRSLTSKIGNYWGNAYTGSDTDGNGIGDAAFALPNNAGSDEAPLMGPIAGYAFSGIADDGPGSGNDDPENDGGTISLNATILPRMEFTISADSIDFGAIRPGRSSEPQTVTIRNTGACDIVITAEVTAESDELYKTGLWIDDGLWSVYAKPIGAEDSADASLVLKVPGDYDGTASPSGQIVFWAESS